MEALKIARVGKNQHIPPEEKERVRPFLVELIKEHGSIKPVMESTGLTHHSLTDIVPDYVEYLRGKALAQTLGAMNRYRKPEAKLEAKPAKRKYVLAKKKKAKPVKQPKPMLVTPMDLQPESNCTVIVVRGTTNVMQALLAAAAEHAK